MRKKTKTQNLHRQSLVRDKIIIVIIIVREWKKPA